MYKTLQIPPRLARKLSQMPLIAGRSPKVMRFADLYYDTPDMQLLKLEMVFRRRMQGRREILSLSTMDENQEWQWKPTPVPSGGFDFSALASHPECHTLIALQDQLRPIFSVVYQRRIWPDVPHSGILVEFSADLGQIKCGDATRPFCALRLKSTESGQDISVLEKVCEEISVALGIDSSLAAPVQTGYEMHRTHRTVRNS